jgi:MFS transporter, DHA3 family, macrolide efflux protein
MKHPAGMQAFVVLWSGQVISLLGSAMTWFAFTLWVWQKTGQASALAAVSFLVFLPSILFMPIAGTMVDRWERKQTLMLSDLGSAFATLIALVLYQSDALALWHIYLLSLLVGFFTAFQYPAYMAATATLLPKTEYARAQGMIGLAQSSSKIFAPLLAAALLPFIGMGGIMTIDLLTFLVAFGGLLWIKIPPHTDLQHARPPEAGFTREVAYGFRYIFAHPTLRSLTILFIAANFFLAIGATLLAPTILSYTSNDESALATILSVGAVGGIVGGGLLSIWGGPKRRVHGILLGGVAACLVGISLFGLARSVMMWAAASFFFSFFEPFVQGSDAAIRQSIIRKDALGRVFSAQQLLTQIPYLIGVGASGWLAEFGMAKLVGTENGLHLSVMLVFAGIFGAVIFLSGYAVPSIRHAEREEMQGAL